MPPYVRSFLAARLLRAAAAPLNIVFILTDDTDT